MNKPKNIKCIYFSATGTTEKVAAAVAQRLGKSLGVGVETVDFTSPAAREREILCGAEDLAVFGVPTYAGRVPNVLLPFLNEKVHGGGALAVPIVLYGNRNFDDSLMELRNILEENNFHTIAAGAFVGEHSFSYTLGALRPDERDMAEAERLADMVFSRLEGDAETPVAVAGENPVRPYYTPRDRAGNGVNILKVKPKTNDKCDGCGICAEVCPMGSIDKADPTSVVGICIKCGACVKKCPKGAKYYDDEKYLYHKTELEQGYARRGENYLF